MSNLMFFLFFFLSDVKNALLGRCQYRVTIKHVRKMPQSFIQFLGIHVQWLIVIEMEKKCNHVEIRGRGQ